MAVMLSELKNDQNRHRLNRLFFSPRVAAGRTLLDPQRGVEIWLTVGILCLMMGGFSLAGRNSPSLPPMSPMRWWTSAPISTGSCLRLTVLGVLRFGADLVQQLIDSMLAMHWWRWLTEYIMDNYLYRHAYYHILQDEKIDNPDQRIQQEVEPFCGMVGAFPGSFSVR